MQRPLRSGVFVTGNDAITLHAKIETAVCGTNGCFDDVTELQILSTSGLGFEEDFPFFSFGDSAKNMPICKHA